MNDAQTPSGSKQPNRGPDIERLVALLELADSAEEALDNETHKQFMADENMPEDCEMWVTAATVRKLFKVFAEIDRLRRTAP